MNWPGAADYRDALQHPAKALRPPELHACKVEANKMGVPRARSGAFANVYKLIDPPANRAVALKLFLHDRPERSQRYQAVADHLKKARPAGLVESQYHAEGIRVGKNWFPILTMEWVAGLSLRLWAEERVQKGDAAALRAMADAWAELVRGLQAAKVAHGGLSHEDVMVVGDRPVLVDYDCMVVPPLVGQESFEDGKPSYEHPGRAGQKLSLDLDRFPAGLILVSLRALAADPSLYQKHVVAANKDALLFSEDDLKKPADSALWKDLLALSDAEARGWATKLREALDKPFDQVPPFPAATAPTPTPAPAPPPPPRPLAPAPPPAPKPAAAAPPAPPRPAPAPAGDWPAAGDYRDALQAPARAFRSPELQACRVETNRMGLPRARAGAFANVYKLIHSDQSATALKVFLYPNPQRMERYQAISDHLDDLGRQNRRPACLVRYRYDPAGIRSPRGGWFPIQTMDWVKGHALRQWVEERAQAGDATALRDMAGRWAAALRALRQADVAHGDLMHDNVMVVGGEPVLVDYDCLTVPALVGRDAFEDGHGAYQHPGRRGRKLSLDLDHFGAWVIWLTLRALAADPALFQKHVVARKVEGLLFTPDDVQRPSLSPVWPDLLASGDAEVRQCADRLRGSIARPFEQVPRFEPPG